MKKYLCIAGALAISLTAAIVSLNLISYNTVTVSGDNITNATEYGYVKMDILQTSINIWETCDVVLAIEVSDKMDLPVQDGSTNDIVATKWQLAKKAAGEFIDNVILPQSDTKAGIVIYGGGNSRMLPWDNHRILSGFINDPNALKELIDYPTAEAIRESFFGPYGDVPGNSNLTGGFAGAATIFPLSAAVDKSVVVFAGSPPDSAYSSRGRAVYDNPLENTRLAAENLKNTCENLKIYCFAVGDDSSQIFPDALSGKPGYAQGVYSGSQDIILEEAIDSLSRRYYRGVLSVFEIGEGWNLKDVNNPEDAIMDVGGNIIWSADNIKKGASLSFTLYSEEISTNEPPCTALSLIPNGAGAMEIVAKAKEGRVIVAGNSVVYIPETLNINRDTFKVRVDGEELEVNISITK